MGSIWRRKRSRHGWRDLGDRVGKESAIALWTYGSRQFDPVEPGRRAAGLGRGRRGDSDMGRAQTGKDSHVAGCAGRALCGEWIGIRTADDSSQPILLQVGILIS